VHDAHADDPSHAFDLSRLADLSLARTPIGVFRSVRRPVYDDLMRDQLVRAAETQGAGNPTDQLASLLNGSDTWTVG
jgi:2-oxoglutarate ferredoxin oxidoreductase subunit beta